MEEHAMTSPGQAILPAVDTATKLAVDRTRLAYERTMMAWLRTSTSLITFGFSIQKFFQIASNETGQNTGLLGPANFGRLMILIGLLILVLATLEHRKNIKGLRQDYPFVPRSMATAVAALIAVLGVLAMISAMMRR